MKRYIKSDAFVQLTPEEMNNPNGIDLKAMARRAVAEENARNAKIEHDKKVAEAKKKYAGLLEKVDKTEGEPSDKLEVLFSELVPASGKADTVAGELVRAMMKILYRDLNDGDVFYEGYGLETCGDAAAFLHDKVSSLSNSFERVAEEGMHDDEYTSELEDICALLVKYVLANPDLIAEPNTDDMQDWDSDIWEDFAPKYEFDAEMPYKAQEYANDNRVEYSEDDFTSWLEEIVNMNFNEDAYVDQWARDAWTIRDLDSESYQTLSEEYDRWASDYCDELENEFGSLEDLEDEEEEEDEKRRKK